MGRFQPDQKAIWLPPTKHATDELQNTAVEWKKNGALQDFSNKP
jgi:hypothetical protein